MNVKARDDSSLRQLMEDVRSGADPSATHKLQQAFADKYMGGGWLGHEPQALPRVE